MLDHKTLLERLTATFVDELDEHVVTLSTGILALDKGVTGDEREEWLTRILRAAHSLKGASRAVEQNAIESFCHILEDAYTALRDGKLDPDQQLCSLLLKTTDAIEEAGQALRAKEPVGAEAFDKLGQAVQAVLASEACEIPEGTAKTSTGDSIDTAEPDSGVLSAPAPAAPAPAAPAQAQASDDPPVSGSQEAGDAVPVSASGGGAAEAPGVVRSRKHSGATVRVAQEKLDTLLAQTGELLVARQRIDGHAGAIDGLLELVLEWKQEWQSAQRTLVRLVENTDADPLLARSPQLASRLVQTIEQNGERLRSLERSLERQRRGAQADARQLNSVGGAVQDQVHNIRMVPFDEVCGGLERAVRDIAATTGKDVELVLKGGDIEVDRSVITGLTDPLLHLVRNAVDHGIESPATRSSHGKLPRGRVTVSASLRGALVQVVVSDDGQGLDLERIRARVRQRGLPEPTDEPELINCIFLPGFSTAEVITDVSGRGVGMDVVKSQVENLRGSIEISSEAGLGTQFTLLVPLTLTTINAVFARLGGQTFLIPSSNVSKLVGFQPAELRNVQGQETLPLGGAPLPVVSLSSLLGRESEVRPSESGRLAGVVLTVGASEAVVVVDEVTSEREIVVKNLGPRIHRVPHVSGATLLQSGEIALLLNAASLMRTLSGGGRRLDVSVEVNSTVQQTSQQRVLVVDDSVTTRTLIRSILEAAGYDVEAAVDGRDAWDKLQSSREGFEAVVSDVDMPRMTGFELTKTIRESERHQSTPVILCTSRGSDEDKARGVRVGATAYLVKSQFDQTSILETIEQLI